MLEQRFQNKEKPPGGAALDYLCLGDIPFAGEREGFPADFARAGGVFLSVFFPFCLEALFLAGGAEA